jgi:hypothetical protein
MRLLEWLDAMQRIPSRQHVLLVWRLLGTFVTPTQLYARQLHAKLQLALRGRARVSILVKSTFVNVSHVEPQTLHLCVAITTRARMILALETVCALTYKSL